MSMPVRDPQSVDRTRLFESGCVKSRLKELEAFFKSKMQLEDMRQQRAKLYKESIEQGKEPKPPPLHEMAGGEIEERYGEKARKLAKECLEKERQAYVDFHADRLKGIIELTMKRLRPLVWTVDEKGKVTKVTRYTETVVEPDYRGEFHKHDIMYIEERGNVELLHQINRLKAVLNGLRDYAPYMPKDLKKLYQDALELGRIKHVRIEEKVKA